MLSVELKLLVGVLQATGQGSSNISALATEWSATIENAIWNTTVRVFLIRFSELVLIMFHDEATEQNICL
jgi:hypothetical protein